MTVGGKTILDKLAILITQFLTYKTNVFRGSCFMALRKTRWCEKYLVPEMLRKMKAGSISTYTLLIDSMFCSTA